jgi:hypothetical protein
LWKESTSTSPSGCHLGHYKAMINDPDWQGPGLCGSTPHEIDHFCAFLRAGKLGHPSPLTVSAFLHVHLAT